VSDHLYDRLLTNSRSIRGILDRRSYADRDAADAEESEHSMRSLSSEGKSKKGIRGSIHNDDERRKRDGFKTPKFTLPLAGIYGCVAVRHGNSRNMADISNDYHLRHRTCVRIGIASFKMP